MCMYMGGACMHVHTHKHTCKGTHAFVYTCGLPQSLSTFIIEAGSLR